MMTDYLDRLEEAQGKLDRQKVRWNAQLRWETGTDHRHHARAQEGMRHVHSLYQDLSRQPSHDERHSWLAGRLLLRRQVPAVSTQAALHP